MIGSVIQISVHCVTSRFGNCLLNGIKLVLNQEKFIEKCRKISFCDVIIAPKTELVKTFWEIFSKIFSKTENNFKKALDKTENWGYNYSRKRKFGRCAKKHRLVDCSVSHTRINRMKGRVRDGIHLH